MKRNEAIQKIKERLQRLYAGDASDSEAERFLDFIEKDLGMQHTKGTYDLSIDFRWDDE